MGQLKTSMNSQIRVGTVNAAEVESPVATLGGNLSANVDTPAMYTLVLFLAAVVFLYVIL